MNPQNEDPVTEFRSGVRSFGQEQASIRRARSNALIARYQLEAARANSATAKINRGAPLPRPKPAALDKLTSAALRFELKRPFKARKVRLD